MGHTDVVPVNPEGWTRDPFGGELVDGEVWGRGAVDMLNLTASMAVAFQHARPARASGRGATSSTSPSPTRSRASAHGARWMADHEPDAIRADYVLTENGGLHSGPAEAAVRRRQRRREGRRLAPAPRAGHARPRLDAVPQRQRAREGRRRRAAPRRLPPAAEVPRAVARARRDARRRRRARSGCCSTRRGSTTCSRRCRTRRGRAPARVHAHDVLVRTSRRGRGEDERDPRLRRHRGRHPHAARRGRGEVQAHLDAGARRPRRRGRGRDPHERPGDASARSTRRCGTACSGRSPARSRPRASRRS